MGATETKRNATRNGKAETAAEVWELISELAWHNKPKFMAVCREFELFPPQVMVLRALEEPKPMREVARFLACDNSNLTGIIDRLEERDLVRRTADPKDRRVKLLVLTDEGQRMRADILSRVSEPPAELAALPAADLRALREILGRTSR
jgi:DNA-binding MarR family transcriptional regulator